MKSILENKKGQMQGGLITGLVFGVASLIIGVIIAFVIVNTLMTSDLLSAGSENNSATALASNFTAGVDKVSAKIPTVLLVAAIVLILGVLAILVGIWQKMRMGGSSL